MTYDIAIIGGGPGGYVAAIRAAQLGAKVALVEKHVIGGTCLNYGCIPTKTFFKTAQLLEDLSMAEAYGLSVSGVALDVDSLQIRRKAVVTELTTGIAQILRANGVDIVYGIASFKSPGMLEVTAEDGGVSSLSANNVIIATGSKVSKPTISGIDSKKVVTSRELLEFDSLPQKLVILGGGVVAMEFASIFSAFGSEVTVVARSSVLKMYDKDVVKRLIAYLKKRNIRILENTGVLEIADGENEALVHVEGKKGPEILSADLVLSAMGRIPSHTGLNLDAIGVRLEGKAIWTDDKLMTSTNGVYAIGDVNGRHMLAHAASHQGIQVVEHIMGKVDAVHLDTPVPACVFTLPELASVGHTEATAAKEELPVRVSKFPFTANGKALSMNHTEGFVKLLTGSDNKLVGAQIMGPHASDLIHELALAITNGLYVDDVVKTVHAHPTLSESVAETAFGFIDGPLHMAPLKKKKGIL